MLTSSGAGICVFASVRLFLVSAMANQMTQVTGPLIGQILAVQGKHQGIGWTDSDTRRAVVAFLAKIIAHGVKFKFADSRAFCTVIAILYLTLDAQQTVATQ